MNEKKYVFSTSDTIRYRFPTHTNELVMDRSESEASESFVVVLEPGESPPIHRHEDYEQLYYVLQGTGRLEINNQGEHFFAIKPGDFIRIPANTYHCVKCTGEEPVRYLSIDCFIGNKSRKEQTWDNHVQAMCVENNWDFDEVKGLK
jgi:quercetin dioxygenase-like cupin family protein